MTPPPSHTHACAHTNTLTLWNDMLVAPTLPHTHIKVHSCIKRTQKSVYVLSGQNLMNLFIIRSTRL